MCDGTRRTVRRRSVLRTVATAGFASGASGCLYLGRDDRSATPLEVLHGWTGGDPATAMKSLFAAFKRAHPETPLDERPVTDSRVPDLAERRITSGDPPGTFLTRLGGALERFGSDLRDVGGSVWDVDLRDAHLATAREACRTADELAGVPLGAHRVNELFYDPAVLAAADVDPTDLTSVEALLDACERVDDQTDATPFAHSLGNARHTTRLLETVLVADAGGEAYRRWRRGVDATRALERAVTLTGSLLDWNGTDASDWTLADSTRRVADGDAAFVQQGSWGASFLAADGDGFGTEWNRIPFPGTGGLFTFDLFGFVVPADAPAPGAGRRWLRFLGSRDGQRAANAPSQSVPTRTDVDPAALGEYQRPLYADLTDAGTRIPSIAHGGAVSPEATDAVINAVARHMLGDSDAEHAASALADAIGEQE